ncbi:hypothetical protein OGAPHI_004722 [Ogataea philodendri]|uniref:Ubiquitin-like protease family profile domain-containing protein n=1 Tax=Ogataea philodendri TaxID=1378263 RepID=A0A9P8T2N4_9ASCO|nr:uncharacterized protein OGAPHI_004722 [Ogataea philodendri]KAH3664008.1 hypothetical protein OGAPHI_004722 [Ogataea philodendri]
MFDNEPPYKRKAFGSLNGPRLKSAQVRQIKPSDSLLRASPTKITIPRQIEVDTRERGRGSQRQQGAKFNLRRVRLFTTASATPNTVSDQICLNSQSKRLTIYSLQANDEVYFAINYPQIKSVDFCSNPESSFHFVINLEHSINGTYRNRNIHITRVWVFVSLSDESGYEQLVRDLGEGVTCNKLTAAEMNNAYMKKEEPVATVKSPTRIEPIAPSTFYGKSPAKLTPFSSDLDSSNILDAPRARQTRNAAQVQIDEELDTLAEFQDENIDRDDQIVFDPPLKYRFASRKSMIVSNKDFNSLYNGNWVNDSIVDFFMQYNLQRARKAGTLGASRIELFNSFFYTKLTMFEPDTDYYANVRSWFKSNDTLFDNDFVVIPIMKDLHWFFVLITNLPRLRHFGSTDTEPEVLDGLLTVKKKPIANIFVLDSLQKLQPNIASPIKNFLVAYAKDKYNLDIPISHIRRQTCNIPQQKNFNDCGLHVIYNANKFFENPDEFKAKILTEFRRKRSSKYFANALFDDDERKVIRKRLRDELVSLLREQVAKDGGDVSTVGVETYGSRKARGLREPSEEAELPGSDLVLDDEIQIVNEISHGVQSKQFRSESEELESQESDAPIRLASSESAERAPLDEKVSLVLDDNGSLQEVVEVSDRKRASNKENSGRQNVPVEVVDSDTLEPSRRRQSMRSFIKLT